MEDQELFEAQRLADAKDRIAELQRIHYQATKARCTPTDPAHTFCGPFSGLLPEMRFCDVPDYIEYLISQLPKEPNRTQQGEGSETNSTKTSGLD